MITRHITKQTGFTLIEMAGVLTVIGLILGAVSIAKDAQRNAEYIKIKQKFVDQWVQAYNLYYQRTGVVIADSQTLPLHIVGGASLSSVRTNPTGGIITQADLPQSKYSKPPRICHGQGYSFGSVGSGDRGASATATGATISMDLFDQMDQHGIKMPPGRAEGREDRYVYLDSNGNPAELQICFQWNPPNTASGSGNVMVLRGLTPDLARMLDQQIDGKADAREGRFRMQGIIATGPGTNNAGTAGFEWQANNTYDFSTPSGNGSGNQAQAQQPDANRLDEDQVQLVTAHYQMQH